MTGCGKGIEGTIPPIICGDNYGDGKDYVLFLCSSCQAKISKELRQTKLEVKSGCDANDDGIPPKLKSLGILPTIL